MEIADSSFGGNTARHPAARASLIRGLRDARQGESREGRGDAPHRSGGTPMVRSGPRKANGTANGNPMSARAARPLQRQVASRAFIRGVSALCGAGVFLAAILIQWLIYVDWMHRHGPLRVVGSVVAGMLAAYLVSRLLLLRRRRKLEMIRRFETIARMNDRIRNSLQAIECVSYAADPAATRPVRDAVNAIEAVLEEVLVEWHPGEAEADQAFPPPPQLGQAADSERPEKTA